MRADPTKLYELDTNLRKRHNDRLLCLSVAVAFLSQGLVRGNHQIAIQTDFQLRALLELHVTSLKQETRATPDAGARGGADRGTLATAQHRTTYSAYGRANRGVGDDLFLVGAFAVDFALFTGGLDRGIAGNARNGGNQRHPALAGFDLIERQLHFGAGVAVLKSSHVAFDGAPLGYHQAAGRDQLFPQLGLEVFAFVHFAGIQRVFQLDDEAGAVRNGVGVCHVDAGVAGLGDGGAAGRKLWCAYLAVFRTGLENGALIFLTHCCESQSQYRSTNGGCRLSLHGVHLEKECKNAWGVRCNSPPEKLLNTNTFFPPEFRWETGHYQSNCPEVLFRGDLKHHMECMYCFPLKGRLG